MKKALVLIIIFSTILSCKKTQKNKTIANSNKQIKKSTLIYGTNFWCLADWSDEKPFVEDVNFESAWKSGKTEKLTNTNIWNKEFLNDIAPFSILRTIEWTSTNNSKISQWNERRQPTHPNNDNIGWISRDDPKTAGIAYKWLIDLCNRTGKDLWINVPHLSTEKYWLYLANLLKSELSPNINIYLEYSNEVWNSTFSQHQFSIKEGKSLALDTYTDSKGKIVQDSIGGGHRLNVYKSVRLFETFEKVFEKNNPRVIKVIGGWTWNTKMTKILIDAFENKKINPNNITCNALIVGPYMGNNLSGDDPEIWNKIRKGYKDSYGWEGSSIPNLIADLKAPKKICNANGWKLFAYEAGQHITTNAVRFNKDPRIYNLYTEYLNSITPYLDVCLFFCKYWKI